MDKSLNIALIGASGVVGQKILKILEKKDINFENLFPLGKSTVGNSIHFQNRDFTIGDIDSFDPKKVNIAIRSRGKWHHLSKSADSGGAKIDFAMSSTNTAFDASQPR